MTYKKYIKRGKKIYGPYYYKSLKKDGKVITEYMGKSEEKTEKKKLSNKIISKKNLLVGIAGLVVILALIFFVNFAFTGKVTFLTENSYSAGEKLQGNIKMVLEQNELIPASTKVIVDNAGKNYEEISAD